MELLKPKINHSFFLEQINCYYKLSQRNDEKLFLVDVQ